MPPRTTITLLAGLLLVAMNAVVAGHWLSIKSALVSTPGTGTAGLSLGGGLASTVNRITNDAKNVGNAVGTANRVGNSINDKAAGVGNQINGQVGGTVAMTGGAIAGIVRGASNVGTTINNQVTGPDAWWRGVLG